MLCRGDITHTSAERGVAPMLRLLDGGADLRGFAAADKVVGKAAAMLFVLAGVSSLCAEVISRPAAELLTDMGLEFSYSEITDMIINRKGDGQCPMELAVMDITDPKEGYLAIKKRLDELRKDRST